MSRTSLALERLGMNVVSRAARITAAGCSVRIALHPDDVARPHLVLATVDPVRAGVAWGAVARTYAHVLADLRARG